MLMVDSTDDNYMPKRVTVFGGEGDGLKKLSDVTLDEWDIVFLFLCKYIHQGGYVTVCVCLSVCKKNNSNGYEQILM